MAEDFTFVVETCIPVFQKWIAPWTLIGKMMHAIESLCNWVQKYTDCESLTERYITVIQNAGLRDALSQRRGYKL